jgi:hypothetical protein
MIYHIGIKGGARLDQVKAKTELEARVKFCKERGLDYRVYANKLEVKTKSTKELKQ